MEVMDRKFVLEFGVGAACIIVIGLVLHAVTLGLTQEVSRRNAPAIAIPTVEVIREDSFKAGDIPTSTVNITARDEKKQQCSTGGCSTYRNFGGMPIRSSCYGGSCYSGPCSGGSCSVPVYSQPIYSAPRVVRDVQITPIQVTPVHASPVSQPVVQASPQSQQPVPSLPVIAKPDVAEQLPAFANDARPVSKYQLALFVDSSARSQEVLSWFNSDPSLVNLKNSCQWQVYTDSSAMYKQRFSGTIPKEAFPVVMFLKPDGGHIHVAGNQDIPTTAQALYSDLQQGWVYTKQMNEAKMGQRPPCPDGNCPIDPDQADEPPDEPRFPLLRRPLLDRNRDGSKDGMVWDFMWGGKEINAALLVLGVLAIMVVIAAVVRARS